MAIRVRIDVAPKVSACEAIINYTFTDKLLLLQALNNSGYSIPYLNTDRILPKNNALAALGDARLDSVLCRWWWDNNTVHVPEEWDSIRTNKLCNKALAPLGILVGLDTCIITDPGKTVCSDDKYMIARVVEAVMGAVYLEGGEEELEKVLKRLKFDEHAFL